MVNQRLDVFSWIGSTGAQAEGRGLTGHVGEVPNSPCGGRVGEVDGLADAAGCPA